VLVCAPAYVLVPVCVLVPGFALFHVGCLLEYDVYLDVVRQTQVIGKLLLPPCARIYALVQALQAGVISFQKIMYIDVGSIIITYRRSS